MYGYPLSNLFCQVADYVWRTNREGPIEHPQKKHKSIAFIACGILPFAPHKLTGSIAPTKMWHHCTDNDGDENPNDDQNTVHSCKHGERPVQIENQTQVQTRYAKKTCHLCVVNSG